MSEFANIQEGLSFVFQPILIVLAALYIASLALEAIWMVLLIILARTRRRIG